MKFLVLITVLLSSIIFVSAQTEINAALQEAEKLSIEVVKLFRQKDFEKALPFAQKVVSIKEKELDKNDLSLAEAWRNLAYIQLQLKKDKEAEQSFENALEIFKQNKPLSKANEEKFADMMQIVAVYAALNGDLPKAEKNFLQAIEIYERIKGADDIVLAQPLFKLAQIYQVQNNYEKSASLLSRALKIQTGKTGKIDDDSDPTYSHLVCNLSKLGREDEINSLRNKYYPPQNEKMFSTAVKPSVIAAPKDEKNAAKVKPPKEIAGGVINGKAISLYKPIYPAEAGEKGISGSVNVRVKIDTEGNVVFACAESGPKELWRASEVAAYNSKFYPTKLSGQPVNVNGIIIYNYNR